MLKYKTTYQSQKNVQCVMCVFNTRLKKNYSKRIKPEVLISSVWRNRDFYYIGIYIHFLKLDFGKRKKYNE